MSAALAVRAPGGARPEFIPYIHGATLGRPSRGRPEKVLAHLKMTIPTRQEDGVPGGRSGGEARVTGRTAVPGGVLRNGLPESGGYEYGGDGGSMTPDQAWKALTGGGEPLPKRRQRPGAQAAPAAAGPGAADPAEARRLAELEEELAGKGIVVPDDGVPAKAPGPVPKRPRRKPARRGAGPAVPSPEPEAGSAAAPEPLPAPVTRAGPAPAPVRCRKCTYLTGTVGHRIACGDAA